MADEFVGGAPPSGDSAGSPSPSQSGGGVGSTGAAAPEPTFDVTINGKLEKVPQSELLKGYSRHQDYTQKTQRLASERQAIQSQIQEYEQALREVQGFLQDPRRVEAYYRSLNQEQGQAPQGDDPMQLLTRQEAMQLMQQQMQQVPQMVGSTQQQLDSLRLEMATREYKGIFDNKIAELQKNRPELARLGQRGAAMIRMEALNQRPQTVDDALQALEFAADAVISDLGNVLKQEAVAAGPGLRNGIEPPGGHGVLPAPSAPFKKISDPGLRAQIMQDLINSGSKQ